MCRPALAWAKPRDVSGEGRPGGALVLRHQLQLSALVAGQVAAQAAPWNDRVDFGGDLPFEESLSRRAGRTDSSCANADSAHRSRFSPSQSSFSAIDRGINSTRVQSWNATVERRLGTGWAVSASYLGSYTDAWWARRRSIRASSSASPCTLNGVNYPVCSTTANLEARRTLTLENPAQGRAYSYIDQFADIGEKTYSALKVSMPAAV